MDDRLLLANARLVLADEVIDGGWLVAVNGVKIVCVTVKEL